jgi:glycine cleavage system H protein
MRSSTKEELLMTVPDELMYSRAHEWIKTEGDAVVVGITHYAQDQLGEVVYVELPDIGTGVGAGDELGTIESVKAVSEFLAPVAGEVLEVNERLEDAPNLVNDEPYGDGWLVKMSGSVEGEDLLDAAAYQEFLEQESD